MDVQFQCSYDDCGMLFPVEDSFAHREIPCPNCGNKCEMTEEQPKDSAFLKINETLIENRVANKRYESLNQVGQGGMGTVIRCSDKTIGRSVAMKVMRKEHSKDEAQRMRFLEEAQITGQLEHPNIVPIHELGQDEDGNLYFTMKMVKGRSLEELIWENKTGQRHNSLAHFLSIFLKICDAIAFAHARGVLHRDLKPANIMIGDYGEVLVMDWGLAKIKPEATGTGVCTETPQEVNLGTIDRSKYNEPPEALSGSESGESSGGRIDSVRSVRSQSRMVDTKFGNIQGTPAYMAPEQALGTTNLVNHRTDIYALGAILYEILTFKRAIDKGSIKDVLQKVADGDFGAPEVRTPLRKIPSELSRICMKAMARESDKRYHTVRLLEKEIDYYVENAAVQQQAKKRESEGGWSASGFSLMAWATLGALVFLLLFTSGLLVKVKLDVIEAERTNLGLDDQLDALQSERDKARAASVVISHQLDNAAEELARLAIVAEAEGNLGDAIMQADAAVKIHTDSPWGHYAWAVISVQRDNLGRARQYLDKALANDPDHAESLHLQTTLTIQR